MRKLYFTLMGFLFMGQIFAQPSEAIMMSNWSDSTLVGSSAHNNTYNEIWGYARDGHEYAIIGTTKGTHFIDVTDPTAPFEAFDVEGKAGGTSIIHRDYHDYKGYLYVVADEGPSSLQIIDISSLPDSVSVVYDNDELIRRSHNIFIDTSTAKLYSCATRGNQGFSALEVFDISTPTTPVFLSSHNSFEGYNIGHVHDVYVQNDTAYLNCGGNGLVIASFADTKNPKVLSILRTSDYPHAGYNHSGWLSEDGRYYYMADETHGADIKVIDLIDITNPDVVSTFNAESSSPSSIPHNLIVKCDHLYVSYYFDGLQVYDISERGTPNRELFYDTYAPANDGSYKGAWGVYPFLPSGNILISDMQSGLFVFGAVADESCNQTSTSTKEISSTNNSFKIWPTIVESGRIEIDFAEDVNSEITTNIMSANGQIISRQTWQNSAALRYISVPTQYSAGIYFLVVHVNGQSIAQKILIP